jgi:hypothetical protein
MSEALDLVWRIAGELGVPAKPLADWNAVTAAAFATVAAESRASVEERTIARWTEPSSGRRLLDAFAARTYSSTWAIPDALMPVIVARLAPALRRRRLVRAGRGASTVTGASMDALAML